MAEAARSVAEEGGYLAVKGMVGKARCLLVVRKYVLRRRRWAGRGRRKTLAISGVEFEGRESGDGEQGGTYVFDLGGRQVWGGW